MKSEELRIGNCVRYLGSDTIVSVVSDGFISTLKSGAIAVGQADPIPLTKEWLFKLGFKDQTSTFGVVRGSLIICGEYAKILYAEYIPFMVLDIGGNRMPLHHIKHVHQLQNLLSALTSKELI